MTVDVLIAADEAAARDAVRAVLEAARCRIIGECGAGRTVVDLARLTDPGVVVLSWARLDQPGADLVGHLRHAVPGTRIVVHSWESSGGAGVAALEAGADEYVEGPDLATLVDATIAPDDAGESAPAVADRRSVVGALPPPEAVPYRVLIIDDDPTARRLLRLSLELEAAEVAEASSLSEARSLLGHHFDGVVLDRRLPDGDGLDLLPALAKRLPQASIVVCSNVDDDDEPRYVLHVPKSDMEQVVTALGLVGGVRSSLVDLVRGGGGGASENRILERLPEIVGRWAAALGPDGEAPSAAAARSLITQLVAPERQECGAGGRTVGTEDAPGRRRPEVTVHQLVDLRQQLIEELGRQIPQECLFDVLAAVDRELDIWILAVGARDLQRLRRQALTDSLTGLLNRWAFDEALTGEVVRSSRYRRPFSVVILDVDGLKAVNDRKGHLAGDAVLVAMAAAIRTSLRVSDSAYRVGGDEFVILLPETPKGVVPRVIERIHASHGPPFSWGAATYLEDTEDSGTVVDLADRQLVTRRQVSRGLR